MKILQVTWLNWQCNVVLPDGRLGLVTFNGSPTLPPVAEWRPIHAVACSERVVLLEWQSDGGGRATWYLDANLAFVANHFADLDLEQRRSVDDAVLCWFGHTWDQLVCTVEPKLPESCRSLGAISWQTLQEILLRASLNLPELSSDDRNLEDTNPDDVYVVNVAGRRLRLESRALLALLDDRFDRGTTFPSDMSSALQKGFFAWPSPVDGQPLTTSRSIPLQDGVTAYRVTDERHQLVFYVISAWAHKAFVYIPTARTLYFRGTKSGMLKQHFDARIEHLFVRHICENVGLLANYLPMETTGFSLVLRLGHMGHHLWNELTQVGELLQSRAYHHSSNVILMRGSQIEPLGRIDEIFPQMAGRVMRDIQAHGDLARYCYSEGRCVVEPTTSYITRELADRIVDVSLMDPSVQRDVDDLVQYASSGFQVLLIGLRLENRTDTDLVGFCDCVIAAARQVMDRLVVVIDCLNAEYHGCGTEFLNIQSDIASQVAVKHRNPWVKIIDLSGAPISRSLFWSRHARYFVAIWGAGLAKYRWLTNRPGLVVSSRWNLLHRDDLHIYDSADYMEDPAPIEFIDAGLVHDMPDAPILQRYVLQDARSTANFHTDRDGLSEAVRRLCVAGLQTQAV